MTHLAEILRMALRASALIALAPFALAFVALVILQQVALGLVMIDSLNKPVAA
jgi:hypothetical protein